MALSPESVRFARIVAVVLAGLLIATIPFAAAASLGVALLHLLAGVALLLAVLPIRVSTSARRTLGGLAALFIIAAAFIAPKDPEPKRPTTERAPTAPAPAAAVQIVPTSTPVAPTATTAAPTVVPTARAKVARRGDSPEVDLAIQQFGQGLAVGDPRIQAFARLLDELDARCAEDRARLAELTMATNRELAASGAREAPIETLGEVRQGVTDGEGQDCADLFTDYREARVREAAPPVAAPSTAPPVAAPPPAPPTAAPAIAPAAAPPSAAKPATSGTIVCSDGYVWPGATRQGACNGHGGIMR